MRLVAAAFALGAGYGLVMIVGYFLLQAVIR